MRSKSMTKLQQLAQALSEQADRLRNDDDGGFEWLTARAEEVAQLNEQLTRLRERYKETNMDILTHEVDADLAAIFDKAPE